LTSFDENNSDSNNNADSEDGGSQNSADSNEIESIPSSKLIRNKKNEANKRLSLNSNNSFSNIPVRQNKMLLKQKSTEDEEIISSKKMLSTSVNYEAFVDVTTLVKQQQQQEQTSNSNDVLNKSTSSQKFKSKLPVKK
jgi:hypothetical protein